MLTLSADPNDDNKVWFTEFNHDKIGVLDISIPVPFEIKSLSSSAASKVSILSSSTTNNSIQKNSLPIAARLNVEVTTNTKNPSGTPFINYTNANNNHNLIFLNISSSMNPLGRFVNLIPKFIPTSIIDLNTAADRKIQSSIILQRNDSTPIPPGNYTLGISATDGTVTKSFFRYLFVK